MKHLLACSLFMVVSVPVAAQVLQDPTRPAVQAQTSRSTESVQQQWVLESVVSKKGQHKAIISGQLYAQGDKLADYTVTNISAHAVLLVQGAKQLKLELYSNEIKQ